MESTHAGTRTTTSMEAGEAASRELKCAVREVVGSAMGHLGTRRQRSCEEVLAQLPLLDNSFYCYELVRQLQSLISSHLSPMVTGRVGGARLGGENCHYTAAVITEEVLESNQYKQRCQLFTSILKETVQELLDDSTHQLLSPAPHSSLSQTTQYFSLDSSLNSDLSQLLGQTALWSPDQLVAIAADLAPSLPTQVRIEAMHHLLQFPIGDLVAMDTWSHLKPVLSETLMDSDPRLAGMSLTLHTHLLSTHSPTSSLEALLSLSHNLSAFFLGKEGVAVTMAMGIDPADDRSLTVLQRMNLLNKFQRDVVLYWIRFGHKTVEDIVRATFDLLSLGNDTLGQLRPIHYLSLLDPTAQWARDWTHAEFSRSVVLEVMRERPGLLEDAVRSLMSSRMRDDKQNCLKPSRGYYNECSLHYLHFSHSLSLVGQVVRWKNGRNLFPITLDIGKFSISDVLSHLMNIVYALPPPTVTSDPWSHTSHVTSLDPAHQILHLLQGLVAGSDSSVRLVAQALPTLLSPVRSILEGADPQVAMETLQRVGQIVSRLAASETGRNSLLRSDELLSLMCGFVRHCLLSDTPPVTPVVTTTWLFACRQLYKTGSGLVAVEKYQLHALIAKKITRIGIEEVKGCFGGCGYEIGGELVDNLLGLCGSARGVGSLGSSPRLLEVCVGYMWGRIKQGLQVSWCDRHGYGLLVSQLASTHVGATALIKSGMLAGVLEEVRECGGRGEERLTAPWTHPLDSPDLALHKALSPLLNVVSNFPVVYELMNSDLSTSKTTPTLILWLLGNEYCKSSTQRSSLEDQLIRLKVISIVTTSLDTLVLLEDKYSVLETLLYQHKDLALENGTVPLDETTIVTNRTLVAGHLIGGPSERFLPPLSLSLPDEEYPWPLVTDYPLPTCFYSSTTCDKDLDKDSGLYKKVLECDHAQSRGTEGAWLSELREVFIEEVKERGSLPNDLVAMVLNGVAKTHPLMTSSDKKHPHGSFSPPPSQTALKMIIRYGEQLGLLSPSSSHLNTLTSLLEPHPCNRTDSTHPGFDWLTSVSFLCTRGDVERTSLISLLLHNKIGPSVISQTCHIVELVLQAEAPHLMAVFQLAGCSATAIVSHWTRQVFLNHLDWPHLLLYLATTSLMGPQYQAYWCVSYFRSKEAAILLHYQHGDLLPYLLEYPTGEFHVGQWLGYMRQLEERFTHLTVT